MGGLTSTNQDQDEAEAMRPLWIVRVDPLQKSLQRVIAGGDCHILDKAQS